MYNSKLPDREHFVCRFVELCKRYLWFVKKTSMHFKVIEAHTWPFLVLCHKEVLEISYNIPLTFFIVFFCKILIRSGNLSFGNKESHTGLNLVNTVSYNIYIWTQRDISILLLLLHGLKSSSAPLITRNDF